MTLNSKRLVLAFAAASAVTVLAGQARAQAQDADVIRGRCIDEVAQKMGMSTQTPTAGDESLQRQRTQLYINCMQRHGLRP
jgi:hypothetical protein